MSSYQRYSKLQLKKAVRSSGFKDRFFDWLDNSKISFKNFFDFKYKKERKNKVLDIGELDRVPVEKAVKKDEKNLSRDMGQSSQMKYVKTKSGAVVVTPASLRNIRKDYEGAVIVDAALKD